MKRGTWAIEIRQPSCGECLKWIYSFAITPGGKLVKITACVADELEWRSK